VVFINAVVPGELFLKGPLTDTFLLPGRLGPPEEEDCPVRLLE
jgi:hypothetical protein